MPTYLSVSPTEKSTLVVTASYFDEDHNPVTPKTGTWTLSDPNGNIINSRENIAISGLSTSNNIVLSGDDLAITINTGFERIFTLKITYDSTYGNDLPLNQEATFNIENLLNVT